MLTIGVMSQARLKRDSTIYRTCCIVLIIIDTYYIVQVFHPYKDDRTTLVIRLCSLDASYTPCVDGAGPGSVVGPKGKTLTLVPFAWTVLQLFSK